MKLFLILIFSSITAYAQNGRVFDPSYSDGGSTNDSHPTIFPKPFQSYNYIKTHRGIEVYETYKDKSYSTNESRGTIFSKPFPKYIIIGDKMYETYRTKNSTNESNGTIFTKPFESKDIFNTSGASNKNIKVKITYEVKYKEPLPKYNGSGDITYGE